MQEGYWIQSGLELKDKPEYKTLKEGDVTFEACLTACRNRTECIAVRLDPEDVLTDARGKTKCNLYYEVNDLHKTTEPKFSNRSVVFRAEPECSVPDVSRGPHFITWPPSYDKAPDCGAGGMGSKARPDATAAAAGANATVTATAGAGGGAAGWDNGVIAAIVLASLLPVAVLVGLLVYHRGQQAAMGSHHGECQQQHPEEPCSKVTCVFYNGNSNVPVCLKTTVSLDHMQVLLILRGPLRRTRRGTHISHRLVRRQHQACPGHCHYWTLPGHWHLHVIG